MAGTKIVPEPKPTAVVPKITPAVLPPPSVKVPVPIATPTISVPSTIPPTPASPPKPAPPPPIKYGSVIPPNIKKLDASTYCRGLTGQKMADCQEEVADYNELHNPAAINREKIQAKREASQSTLEPQPGGKSYATSSGEPPVIKILNNREGKMWAAFLRWCDVQWNIHARDLYQQTLAIDATIKKLDDSNSFENRLENFITNPLAIVTTAVASYFSGGAAAGAALAGLISSNDDIDKAISKLRAYKDQLNKVIAKYPQSTSFTTIAPVGATEVLNRGDKILGTSNYYMPGDSPWPQQFFIFVDDML